MSSLNNSVVKQILVPVGSFALNAQCTVTVLRNGNTVNRSVFKEEQFFCGDRGNNLFKENQPTNSQVQLKEEPWGNYSDNKLISENNFPFAGPEISVVKLLKSEECASDIKNACCSNLDKQTFTDRNSSYSECSDIDNDSKFTVHHFAGVDPELSLVKDIKSEECVKDIKNPCYSRMDTLSCYVCNKVFSEKNKLLNHKKVHSQGNTFSCNLCNKNFTRKYSLLCHISVHKGQKMCKNDVCDKRSFQNKRLLAQKTNHLHEKPFTCEICGKSFTKKYILSCHKDIHLKNKTFECDVCDKSFSHKCRLKAHQKVHSKNKPNVRDINRSVAQTGEKPYACHLCNNKFSKLNNLKLHMKYSH